MKKLFAIVLLSSGLLTSVTFGQRLGFEAGASYDVQNGHYIAPCGCTFAGGTGAGFFGSISYDLFSFSDFITAIASGFRYNHVTDYEVMPETLRHILNGDRQQMSLSYFTINPSIRFTIPSTNIALTLSPEFDYLISSSFHHISGSSSDESETDINSDTAIDIRSIRFAATLSAGYAITMGNVIISPNIGFTLPLNTLRSNSTDNDWKISSFSGSIRVQVK